VFLEAYIPNPPPPNPPKQGKADTEAVLAPLLKALDIWAGLAATKTERFPSLARTLAAMETLAGLLDMLNQRMQRCICW
jgi:hypothetical protein